MQDALGCPQSLLVFGATSEIALATVRRLSSRLHTAVLAARNPDQLRGLVEELRAQGVARVEPVAFDATDTGGHDELVNDVLLGQQDELERHGEMAVALNVVNYVGAVSVTVPLAQRMREQGHGTVVVLSSVAGERARRSNFVYGASKAGLDAFAQGLGDSLAGTGVRVMIVRPGFVHTTMTAGLEPAPFATTPDEVADAIARGLARRAEIVWVPGVLRFAMSALRHLPRPIFRKLPL
ncbi:MAG: SDR family NAD(P)-dependent oxidoreductase [Actinobacteria bacterium]|nr:MAG: SDR family NAD(P)-dependent oxidoreductase [Actinomycetota bacterium]